MLDGTERSFLYWDTSAVISSLFEDRHSQEASVWSSAEVTSLLSSLAYAETCAVIARMEREEVISVVAARRARSSLTEGPWRRLMLPPDWTAIESLAGRWRLRGADLWHLATTVTLRRQVPDLVMLSFDAQLMGAAAALGLAPGPTDP